MVKEARKWWNQGENMHYLHNIYPLGGKPAGESKAWEGEKKPEYKQRNFFC